MPGFILNNVKLGLFVLFEIGNVGSVDFRTENVYFIFQHLNTHIFPANCILENIQKGNSRYSYDPLQKLQESYP